MRFRHTLFLYKWKTWLLLQIICAVLMKGRTEAALRALSIFFLLIFIYFRCFFWYLFTFDVFFVIYLLSMFFLIFIYFRCFFWYYALHWKERSSKVSGIFIYICIGVSAISFSAMRYTIVQILFFGSC
jgi:hypothetical protein